MGLICRYDVMFKQKVTSNDIFLGMSGKNPSTACCEDLLVSGKENLQKDFKLQYFAYSQKIFLFCIHFLSYTVSLSHVAFFCLMHGYTIIV